MSLLRGTSLRHYYLLLCEEPLLRDVGTAITTYYFYYYPLLFIANPQTCRCTIDCEARSSDSDRRCRGHASDAGNHTTTSTMIMDSQS